jgi:hypothetical protein
MIYPKSKAEIIRTIIPLTKDNPDCAWKDIPVDKLIFNWFVTGRAGNGLRLTDAGKTAFEIVNIAHYDFDFTPSKEMSNPTKWGKFTLILDKKVKCPYYIGVKPLDNGKKQPYIRLYDNKIAMMLTLYGDLQSYIESVK